MPIIISKNGQDVKRVERISFKREEVLQKYIFENPLNSISKFKGID